MVPPSTPVHLHSADPAALVDMSSGECEATLRWALMKKLALTYLDEEGADKLHAEIAERLKPCCSPTVLATIDSKLALGCAIQFSMSITSLRKNTEEGLGMASNVLGYILRIMRSRFPDPLKLMAGVASSGVDGAKPALQKFAQQSRPRQQSVMTQGANSGSVSSATSDSPEQYSVIRGRSTSRRLLRTYARSSHFHASTATPLQHAPSPASSAPSSASSIYLQMLYGKVSSSLHPDSIVVLFALETDAAIMQSLLLREYAHRVDRKDWARYITRLQESVLVATQALKRNLYRSSDCIMQASKTLALIASEAHERVYRVSRNEPQSYADRVGKLRLVCDSAELLEYLWPLFDTEHPQTRQLLTDMVMRTRLFCVQASLTLASMIAEDEKAFAAVWNVFTDQSAQNDTSDMASDREENSFSVSDASTGMASAMGPISQLLSMELMQNSNEPSSDVVMDLTHDEEGTETDEISKAFAKVANRVDNFLNRLSRHEKISQTQILEYRGDLHMIRAKRARFVDSKHRYVTNEKKNVVEHHVVLAMKSYFAALDAGPESNALKAKVNGSRDFLLSQVGLLPRIFRWGPLIKRGAVRKNWKVRYFALYRERLAYYRSESDMRASSRTLRFIRYSDILHVGPASFEQLDVESVTLPEGKVVDQVLMIETSNRTFFVVAENERDRDGWVDAIRTQISAFEALRRAGVPLNMDE
jgi:hypothetical protein